MIPRYSTTNQCDTSLTYRLWNPFGTVPGAWICTYTTIDTNYDHYLNQNGWRSTIYLPGNNETYREHKWGSWLSKEPYQLIIQYKGQVVTMTLEHH